MMEDKGLLKPSRQTRLGRIHFVANCSGNHATFQTCDFQSHIRRLMCANSSMKSGQKMALRALIVGICPGNL